MGIQPTVLQCGGSVSPSGAARSPLHRRGVTLGLLVLSAQGTEGAGTDARSSGSSARSPRCVPHKRPNPRAASAAFGGTLSRPSIAPAPELQ